MASLKEEAKPNRRCLQMADPPMLGSVGRMESIDDLGVHNTHTNSHADTYSV